jgi:hypothetical protein
MNDTAVTLPKCRHCGGRKFTLRFEPGKVRSCTIVADCVGCSRGRVVSLEEAHRAIIEPRPGTVQVGAKNERRVDPSSGAFIPDGAGYVESMLSPNEKESCRLAAGIQMRPANTSAGSVSVLRC